MEKINREFYNRNTLEVAKDLLGKYLIHYLGGEKLVGKIVEVEAYIGSIDKACHAYNNLMTKRTRVLYGLPGTAYVYLIYGMYHCFNVVTEDEGRPAAVLVRAIEPVEGVSKMMELRYKKEAKQGWQQRLKNLSNGPGKLSMAMGINKNNNEMDLCGNKLFLANKSGGDNFSIISTQRINIDYAEEAVHFPWRYYIKDNPFVSKK